MKLLLDTQLLLWSALGDESIGGLGVMPRIAASLIDDLKNDLFFSPASIWEVAIKSALGRAAFAVDPRMLRRSVLDNGYREVPITSAHGAAVGDLAPLHKDPFDRLLIAQAMVEGIVLLTTDRTVAQYPGPVRRV
ncbi:MAG: type II toxin-antitoxin system VapC family toxin [Caulobacteraceae bacterium]